MQKFALNDVTGTTWTPADDPTAWVLIAHGGGQHSQAPGVVARAEHFVRTLGCGVLALDAPGHGGRPADEAATNEIRRRKAAGEPIGPLIAAMNAERAAQAVPEWRAALDALAITTPVGFWGVSLGTAIGVPLVASEPRITCAVLGLLGPVDGAADVRVPVEFLVQWDDELVPRADALALFDALGSTEKTLHANPGRHVEVPRFEIGSAEHFFRRHF
ncbi:alpha/beta hydrolase [Cryptosporangium japonicum]|uniref:Alpha/beta hydrolase n=1 Tax=Cryptosporangium japonicum TaxID=80872 RepID=A0ABN0U4A1_9ACTN